MRRLIACLLLVLLPLQFGWAAMGACCAQPIAQARDPQPQHPAHHHADHHAHHQADSSCCEQPADSTHDHGTGKCHNHDCGQCHSHAVALPPVIDASRLQARSAAPPAILSQALRPGLIDRPERPNWSRLA